MGTSIRTSHYVYWSLPIRVFKDTSKELFRVEGLLHYPGGNEWQNVRTSMSDISK